jgi:hypothetical protein
MASLPLQTTPDDRIGPAPRHVGLVWTLLTINVLGFLPSDGMLVPVPKVVGQVVTMGALVLALLLALLLNPRITVRPNVYLTLLSALAVVAVASSIPLESGLGSLLRCFRFVVFVASAPCCSPSWPVSSRPATPSPGPTAGWWGPSGPSRRRRWASTAPSSSG